MTASTTEHDLTQPIRSFAASSRAHSRAARGLAAKLPGAGALLAALLAACHGPAAGVQRPGDAAHEPPAPAHEPPSGHAAHWSYEGATGPDAWARLDTAFATCARGTHQSPVDLPPAVPATMRHHIEFHYQAVPLHVVNNGHTVQVDVPAGNYIELDGHRYDLLQFHFHHPSEETVAGKHADMVAHLVHKDPRGALAVVGVLMNAGPSEPAILARIWEHLPAHPGETDAPAGVHIALPELVPADHHFYYYVGSLTTPPCTEDVTWNVMAQPLLILPEHVQAFHALYPTNARPVQPLHDRAIDGGD